jgi:hypothetical protein
MIIEGKNEDSDFFTIKSFDDINVAKEFIEKIKSEPGKKHWTNAEIIDIDHQYEIDYDFNPNI